MGVATLLRRLGAEHGIEIDDDELAHLGLDGEGEDADTGTVANDDVLSQSIPGHAAGMVELFLGDDLSTAVKEPASDADGLMWYPIIREGQWAVRPGQNGKKKRTPLKVVAGRSTNQRREIGLQDLKDAFDDEAIQHVTVPSSHNNTVLENTGFIKGMKIVDGKVKDQKTKKPVDVKVLMGGYDIKLPAVKERMQLGAIANRSAGILYDYVNTETGKTYPAVVEHVALTNKPWITGMVSFGRKLDATDDLQTVSLSLSDEGPSEDEYIESLSLSIDEEGADFLSIESEDWSKEGSPNWLRQQVNSLLEDARAKKIAAARASVPNGSMVAYSLDYPPNYRCVEAKPGKALIADGWGDDANYWAAPISVKQGAVELAEFDKWATLKKAFIPDERPTPAADKLPLEDDDTKTSEPKTRLQLAQAARQMRGQSQDDVPNNDPPRGGGNMAEGNGTLELSAEAQAAIQAAEARAKAAEERADQLSEKVERLTGSVNKSDVDSYIDGLKREGFDEQHGFGGVLVEIRELMLADDGEPAVQSDHFADDSNKEGTLTLSESIRRIMGAFKRTTDGQIALGELLEQPADPEATPAEGETSETPEAGAEASTAAGETTGGKPPATGVEDTSNLSTEDRVTKIAEASPQVAALIGGLPSTNGETPKSEGGGS